MGLGLSGLASGFDWRSLVDQLSEVERTPQTRLRKEQITLRERNTAYDNILAQLNALKTKANALQEATLYESRLGSVGDTTLARTSVESGAATGVYSFNFQKLATSASQQGALNVGQSLNGSNDVSGLVLSSANFAQPITAGTFTINGKRITIETNDTLQAVFDKINTETGGSVTATYDSTTDKISLSSAGPIVLGSATDNSNLLETAKLYNNGTGTVTSAYSLGAVKTSATLASANFTTSITDGGSGNGEFKINGVSISYNATTDTVASIMARINASDANVSASYDAQNDRFTLTNKTTGDIGIALEDVTGNFLAASGLTTGTLSRGQNLVYTINNGPAITSLSNTVTSATSGLTGVSVTALKEGTTSVTVAVDTAKVKSAITGFIDEYNKAQSTIDRYTASSTNADGKVTAGILAGDADAIALASRLRSLVNQAVDGTTGNYRQLANLGISSNGYNDQIALSNSTTLDAALAENLDEVKNLFAQSTGGLAVGLSTFIEEMAGENGDLETKQDTISKQIAGIDTQVSDLERLVQSNEERLVASFLAMEQAQAKMNQQLQFLSQRLGIS